ncbi:hypothetical protein BGZ76_005488 [Entomortierella beljakovae]|nr:hypothetical protein BGZ76_005488 [Entomortierella beljakovae]
MSVERSPMQSRSGDTSPTRDTANNESLLATIVELTNQLRAIPEEISDIKRSLNMITVSLKRLEGPSKISKVTPQDVSQMEFEQPISTGISGSPGEKDSKGTKNSKLYRKKRYTKYYMPRRPNWSLKILDQKGLDPIGDIDTIKINEPTKKCLETNILGYSEKSTLKPLINGNDAVLQIRGSGLVSLTIYPIMDVLDLAVPELQVLIAMNRVDALSSKSFLSSLKKHLEVAGIDVALHIISNDKRPDFESFENLQEKPTIFVSTPDMIAQLTTEGIIKPQIVNLLIVYEAEYCFRVSDNVKTIQSILKSASVCQVILTAHDGTEELVKSIDTLEMSDDIVIFSMDYTNIQLNSHYCYQDDIAETNRVIDYAIELSKEGIVVIICRDMTESNGIKDRLAGYAEILSAPNVTRPTEDICGMFITTQFANRMIPFPDKYLEMMASYIEVGERCQIVTWDEARDVQRKNSLEALGVSFKDIATLFT